MLNTLRGSGLHILQCIRACSVLCTVWLQTVGPPIAMQLTGVSKAVPQLLMTKAWLLARWVMSTEKGRASHGRHVGWLRVLVNH